MCMQAVAIRQDAISMSILRDRSNYRTRRPLLLHMAQQHVVHTSKWTLNIHGVYSSACNCFPCLPGRLVRTCCLGTLVTNALWFAFGISTDIFGQNRWATSEVGVFVLTATKRLIDLSLRAWRMNDPGASKTADAKQKLFFFLA